MNMDGCICMDIYGWMDGYELMYMDGRWMDVKYMDAWMDGQYIDACI